MAGSLAYSPRAGGSTAVPVERLLAKVTANLDCRWDGGTISSVRIRNMNGVLCPFGASAAASASDILPEQEFSEGTGSSSGTFVFYVPENLQGTISGISSSEGKSPDRNGTVRSRLDRLTYIETTVEASGDRTGTVVYSSLLGQNATTNFDIRRNCRYVWTIRFLEEGSRVRVTVMFRGRELSHPERGRDILDRIAEDLRGDATVIQRPTMDTPRDMAMMLSPTNEAIARGEERRAANKGKGGRKNRGEDVPEDNEE
jgi:hypothetical protein